MALDRRARFWFYPYGPSNSVAGLTGLLNGREIRREGSRYAHRSSDVCVNWGCSAPPGVLINVPVLNSFAAVRLAVSKTTTFGHLEANNVSHPRWTTNRNIAEQWCLTSRVFGRDLDTGSKGRGITVYERGSVLGDHRFYVEYWRKQRELRVHVFKGQVIFIQEKLKKNGANDADKYIRSHDRGWCFAFKHLEQNAIPDGLKELATAAVEALGLDFGAVDIGWNARNGSAVFEVNTAPGIEESSLDAYANAFRSLVQ